MKYYYDRYWGLFTNAVYQPGNVPDMIVGVGYSGNQQELNNIIMEDIHDVGPLPAGLYTITSTDEEKGPLTHHLTPDPANKMYGRSGFLIHGDTMSLLHNASDGCIASPYWTRVKFKVGDVFEVL